MNGTAARQRPSHDEWFTSWFDSAHYHRLYAHRDEREARVFVERLVQRLAPNEGASMLDLGCGSGRHAHYLASRGFNVTGMDLSSQSLARARRRPGANVRFVQHDMRQPFGVEVFAYVLNLFTSFGYFEDPGEHLAVVRNMAASLQPGGCVVLDYLNVHVAEAQLRRVEMVEREGVVYRLSRWTDAGAIYKRIVVDGGEGAPLEFTERVAKLTRDDLRFMFGVCGLAVDEVCGDYDLAPFDRETSPRLILIARKQARQPAGLPRDRFLRMRLTVSGVIPR